MNGPFHALRIAGLLEERSHLIEGGLVRIHLQLSEPPPVGWSYLFNVAWRAAAQTCPSQTGVDGDALWIECIPAEFMAHLPQLEAAVTQANETYLAGWHRRISARLQQAELQARTRAQLAELADRLNPTCHPPADQACEDDSNHPGCGVSEVVKSFWRGCRMILTGLNG